MALFVRYDHEEDIRQHKFAHVAELVRENKLEYKLTDGLVPAGFSQFRTRQQ